MSETASARPVLAQYCQGIGIDMGFGGSAIVPTAITFDMNKSYCPSFEGHPQVLRGDCTKLPYVCDCALDYVYSSHLLEDFTYKQLVPILLEWRRILKINGLLIINCPDQQKFLAHCAKTGQAINDAHKEKCFSLQTFRNNVITQTGRWEEVFSDPDVPAYSWYLVIKKIKNNI